MMNAVTKGMFKGCELGNGGPNVSILQYADDTILVWEASWGNI